MPKNLNYPLASFQKAYTLAESVDALGGSCSVEMCAEKMQRRISGGFMVIISSAQKFSLITFEKSIITITEEYKLIKNSNTNNEKMAFLKKAFLMPQVFSIMYDRFKGSELPVNMLDKILISEFGIEENKAGRVAGYFIDGLKSFGLLNGNNIVEDPREIKVESKPAETVAGPELNPAVTQNEKVLEPEHPDTSFNAKKIESYGLQLSGLAISLKINIEDEADLQIAEAVLNKIRKSFKLDKK